MLEFRKISEFPRGTLYDVLQDAYSYDSRNKELWDKNWHESDKFFYDNLEIADKYGLVTCIDDYPIGFVTWDPRNIPEYVDIGHNGIRSAYKRKGYGIFMMQEIESLFPVVKEIYLDTPVWNIRTNSFYQKLGYAEYKRDNEFVYYTKVS